MHFDTLSHDTTVCPSARKIKQYAGGKLKPGVAQTLEHHLVECQSCIGTLQNAFNEDEVSGFFLGEEELLHPRSKKTTQRNFRPAIIIASAGIIMSAIAYGFYNTGPFESKNKFQGANYVQPAKEVVIHPNIKENTTQNDVESKKEVVNPVVEEKKIEPKPEVIITKVAIPEPKPVKKEIVAKKEKPVLAETIPETKPVKKEIAEKKEEPVLVKEIPTAVSKPETVFIDDYKVWFVPKGSNKKNNEYRKQLTFILNNASAGNYNEALTECDNYLSAYPSDETLLYYRGYLSYLMESNEQALNFLNRFSQKKSSVFYDDARWYKSLTLNRMSRFSEAKQIWSEIISANKAYAPKAKQLMELLADK